MKTIRMTSHCAEDSEFCNELEHDNDLDGDDKVDDAKQQELEDLEEKESLGRKTTPIMTTTHSSSQKISLGLEMMIQPCSVQVDQREILQRFLHRANFTWSDT